MNDTVTSLPGYGSGESLLPWGRDSARADLIQWKQSGLLSAPILYSPGTRIFEQGTEPLDAFLLERGVIAFEREPSAKDRSGIFALCLPGHLFGQISDSLSHFSTHSALALTRCSVYRIKREKILSTLQDGGELALFIIRQYLQNLLRARARAAESTIRCAQIRFQQLLQELAAALEDRSPTGSIRLPLKDKELAGVLGISPQQLSVIKRKMEGEKVIMCSGEKNKLALRSVNGTLKFFKAHRYKRISSIA
jgi:CRP-like cAMP-binding protein